MDLAIGLVTAHQLAPPLVTTPKDREGEKKLAGQKPRSFLYPDLRSAMKLKDAYSLEGKL